MLDILDSAMKKSFSFQGSEGHGRKEKDICQVCGVEGRSRRRAKEADAEMSDGENEKNIRRRESLICAAGVVGLEILH